jgi:hypothetical protein
LKTSLSDARQAKRVTIDKDNTTIVDGPAREASGRTERSAQIEHHRDYEEKPRSVSLLAGGVAVIRSAARPRLNQAQDPCDDALHATRAAVEEGIVPGGGVALLYATKALEGLKGVNDDQTRGIDIVRKALYSPVRQIAQNAGHDGAVISGKLLEGKDQNMGFNAQTEVYENLVNAGVIDPTKVVRTALQDAASVAGLLITTEAAVNAEDKPAMPMGGGMGRMGGMDFVRHQSTDWKGRGLRPGPSSLARPLSIDSASFKRSDSAASAPRLLLAVARSQSRKRQMANLMAIESPRIDRGGLPGLPDGLLFACRQTGERIPTGQRSRQRSRPRHQVLDRFIGVGNPLPAASRVSTAVAALASFAAFSTALSAAFSVLVSHAASRARGPQRSVQPFMIVPFLAYGTGVPFGNCSGSASRKRQPAAEILMFSRHASSFAAEPEKFLGRPRLTDIKTSLYPSDDPRSEACRLFQALAIRRGCASGCGPWSCRLASLPSYSAKASRAYRGMSGFLATRA